MLWVVGVSLASTPVHCRRTFRADDTEGSGDIGGSRSIYNPLPSTAPIRKPARRDNSSTLSSVNHSVSTAPVSFVWNNSRSLDIDSLPFCLRPPALLVVNHMRKRCQSQSSGTPGDDNVQVSSIRMRRSITILCRALLQNNIATTTIETILLATLYQLTRLERLLEEHCLPQQTSAACSGKACGLPEDLGVSDPKRPIDGCSATASFSPFKSTFDEAARFSGSSPTASTKSCKSGTSTVVSSPVSSHFSPSLSSDHYTPPKSNQKASPYSGERGSGEIETTTDEIEWFERISDPAWRLSLACYMACAWIEDDVISVGCLVSPFLHTDAWFSKLAFTTTSNRRPRTSLPGGQSWTTSISAYTTLAESPAPQSPVSAQISPLRNISTVLDAKRSSPESPSYMELCCGIVTLFDCDLIRTMDKLDFRLRVDIHDILPHGVSFRIRGPEAGSQIEWYYPKCDDLVVVEKDEETSGESCRATQPARTPPLYNYVHGHANSPSLEEELWNTSPTPTKWWVTPGFDGYDCDPLDAI